MLRDLDQTLEQIIRAAPIAELSNAGISFETPDKGFNPPGGTVNLFLYEVKENLMLRDPVPVTRKQGDIFVRQRPPLRVDCTYVVTAWQNPPSDSNVRASHHLLGQALLWLSRFPVIPEAQLQGTALQAAVVRPGSDSRNFQMPTMVAQMDGSKNSVGEFWSALGIPPRPYFNLVVTVPMDLPLPSDGPLVTTKTLGWEPVPEGTKDTLVAIGGRIVDLAGNPVPDAVIDVLDAGLRVVSRNEMDHGEDQVGRFVLPHVPTGQRTFRVSAVGFDVSTSVIDVTGRSEDYVVQLTPH